MESTLILNRNTIIIDLIYYFWYESSLLCVQRLIDDIHYVKYYYHWNQTISCLKKLLTFGASMHASVLMHCGLYFTYFHAEQACHTKGLEAIQASDLHKSLHFNGPYGILCWLLWLWQAVIFCQRISDQHCLTWGRHCCQLVTQIEGWNSGFPSCNQNPWVSNSLENTITIFTFQKEDSAISLRITKPRSYGPAIAVWGMIVLYVGWYAVIDIVIRQRKPFFKEIQTLLPKVLQKMIAMWWQQRSAL